jgi:hypothetical protein
MVLPYYYGILLIYGVSWYRARATRGVVVLRICTNTQKGLFEDATKTCTQGVYGPSSSNFMLQYVTKIERLAFCGLTGGCFSI